MQKKFMHSFADFLFETYKPGITRWIVHIVIFSAALFPVVLICALSINLSLRENILKNIPIVYALVFLFNSGLAYFISSLIDAISVNRQAEILFAANRKKAAIQTAKTESLGRLAAGIAHEVKNPLAIIQMAANYLSRELKTRDEKTQAVLIDIENAVRRADTIIKGLLDFSVPKELILRPEDLNALMEQSLVFVKHNLDKNQITVIKDLAFNLPPVMLDRNKIEQVFVNLFMNAIHAMPNGGTARVKTFTQTLAGETVITAQIEDTGKGIPEDKIQQIFDPFFTTKPTGQGTGLGLTVTRKIIDLHHATIDIQNRLEGGVRATLMFSSSV